MSGDQAPLPVVGINHSTVMSLALVASIIGAVFFGARAFGDSERRLAVIERDMAQDAVERAMISSAVQEQERRLIRFESKIDSVINGMDEMRRALAAPDEPPKRR